MIKLLLFFILIPSLCFSQVKYLDKGEVAPYSGYLFTPEMEREMRQQQSDLEYLKDIVTQQDDVIKLQTQDLDNKSKQISNLNNMIQNQSESDKFKNILYFILGAAIGYGVTRIK